MKSINQLKEERNMKTPLEPLLNFFEGKIDKKEYVTQLNELTKFYQNDRKRMEKEMALQEKLKPLKDKFEKRLDALIEKHRAFKDSEGDWKNLDRYLTKLKINDSEYIGYKRDEIKHYLEISQRKPGKFTPTSMTEHEYKVVITEDKETQSIKIYVYPLHPYLEASQLGYGDEFSPAKDIKRRTFSKVLTDVMDRAIRLTDSDLIENKDRIEPFLSGFNCGMERAKRESKRG
jgi:hypothetical protein